MRLSIHQFYLRVARFLRESGDKRFNMERIVDVVYRISFRILCDRIDSEYVTRKVLAFAKRKSIVYDGSEQSADWFIRQTCFMCRLTIVRRRALWLMDVRKDVFVRASPKVGEHDDYITKQAWQVYCRAVNGMTPLQVTAYVLFVLEGIPEERAAEIMGLTRFRLRHLLKKATASIRAELAVYGSAGLYRNFVSFIRMVDEAKKPQAKDLLTEYSDSAP